MVGIRHVHRQRITESGNCLCERNAMLAKIRFCLFWIPLKIITHWGILTISTENLHQHNVLGERCGLRVHLDPIVRLPSTIELIPFRRSLDFLTFLAPSDTLSITVEFHRSSHSGEDERVGLSPGR